MEALSPNSAVLDKTRELCSLILQSGEYRDNIARINAFFEDEPSQQAYRDFSELGEQMQRKQDAGQLTQADIDGYEAQFAALRENPVAAGFMDAEKTLNGIVSQVSKMVGKSLELGRIPEPEDLQGGCCGGGCGCG